MRKVYYVFNPKTRTYDRVYPNIAQRLLTIMRKILSFITFGGLSFLVFYLLIETPSLKDAQIENSKLLSQYQILSRRMDDAMDVLEDVQQRDDNLYRVLMNSEPVSVSARRAGYGGTNRYDELMDMGNSDLAVSTTQKMDMLAKQIYIQIKSFDEVVELSKEQEEFLKHLPAIQPLANRDLKKTASGYGWRVDPIYKTRKFHAGMDFSCDTGTPIYATGDGVVVSAEWETAYGLTIEINHGYNYRTRYAHLNKFNVKPGQKVVRGEQIALSGSTGKSTGPHLHYEVEYKGSKVNPVNYYFMDLDAKEYDQMLQMAENHGKVYD